MLINFHFNLGTMVNLKFEELVRKLSFECWLISETAQRHELLLRYDCCLNLSKVLLT
jgi:hypothetical protein